MSDDYDIGLDWGDDPFGGDMDFDMDFDMNPFKGKGFLRSVATGFLSGVVDETVGSSSARFRSMRTILPNTFSNALDKASFINDRLGQLAVEFKEENAESAKSLQNIATHLNQRMGSKLPGFMSEGLSNFSSKDFSLWEKYETRSDRFDAKVGSPEDGDVSQAIDDSINAQSSMFASLGDSLNSMTAAATSAVTASIGAGNRQLVNIESAMRDMLNYQRNVDARLQQAQLNLAARNYVNSAKYYKFMEAGVHAEVAELKKIAKYTSMSDFQKTSTLTASKAYMRDRVFNTVGKRLGGLSGLMRDKFSAENRKETYGVFGSLINATSEAMDMSEGSLSRGMVGNILGKMMGEVAVDKLPYFFKRGPGKKAIDKLTKAYPEQAAYINDQVKKLSDMGNVLSYVSTSGVGMLNYAAQNYQAMDEMKYVDYDHYLDELPPGKKPMGKAAWTALNAASNRGKEAINKLMADTTKSRGTQYTLKRRNVKDLNQPGIWKEINNITLNEVIPGLISKTNTILEQIRTGKDNVEGVNYNYMRGEFQTDSQRRISVQADLMPHGEFQRYAQASLSLVDSLGKFSPGTRKAFAQQVAKDIDAELGFNPYYYLGDIKGMSASAQKEIHSVLMQHFGISHQDVSQYNTSDSFQRLKQMSNMPTQEGRERLNDVSANAANLKANFPNVAERIDLLRSTGNEQMLRDLGVIYTDNGIDKINIQAFHDRIGQYMDDPNNPVLRGVTPGKQKGSPTVKGGMRSSGPGNVNPGAGSNQFAELNETLLALTSKLDSLPQHQESVKPQDVSSVSFDTATGYLGEIKESNSSILTSVKNIDLLMGTMIELAKAGKLMTGSPGTASEQRQEETAKKSFLDKVKGALPTNMMGKGMDFIMSRNPMVLGGMLGAIGAAATSKNFLLSGAMAAGGLLLGVAVDQYQRRNRTGSTGTADAPRDDEDIIDEKGEPILKAAKLRAGEYLDAATKRVIKTWNDIRGPIYDVASRTVIGARDLAGKIFGADGRAVALNGLRRVRDAAVGAYNLADPLGRIRSIINTGKDLVYQQDVYIRGEKEPALRAAKFKAGEYYIRDESGNFKPINGWNEINGPVYDDEGNQLVSEAEYKAGLVTATGMAVHNVGSGIAGVVGGVAGMAKSGVNAILGRFGFTPKGDASEVGSSKGSHSGSNGVEHRLDLIYKMLSQHFNIPMEGGEITEAIRSKLTGGSQGPGLRLNSLAWKKKEAESKEKHKVNDAIIEIAKNTKGMGGDDEKGEGKGFFGKIKDIFMGLGAFGLKLVKNPIGTIGSLVFGSLLKSTTRLAKIGGALFSGVLGVASPIFKLMKWGFGKIAAGLLGGDGEASPIDQMRDAWRDSGDEEPDQRGQGGRRRNRNSRRARRVRNGRRIQRVGRFAKTAGLSAIGSYALNALQGGDGEDYQNGTEDLESGERDDATGRYATTSDKMLDTVTSWLPQGSLAKSVVQGVLGPDGYEDLDNKGLFWTSDGTFFMDRRKRDAAQAALDGKTPINNAPGVDKSNTQLTTQKKIRMAMYGVANADSNLARRIMALENQFYQYVVIKDGRASLKPDTPTQQLVESFANSGMGDFKDKDSVGTWFMARFKPVFMIYNAAVTVNKMGDISSFDNAKSYDVVKVVEQVQRSVAEFNPPPYSIDVRIDSKEATMGPEQTRGMIANLFDKLKKELPAPPAKSPAALAAETETVNKEKNSQPINPINLQAAATEPGQVRDAVTASQQGADSITDKPADVTTINISDMYGKDGSLDAFTLARLAVYGNNNSVPWRIEAVLKLERYVENFILVTGNDARFTGKSSQLLELFKASFHVNDRSTISKNMWSLWFRDRFLPTLMEYCKQVYKLRGGMPSKVWKSLSATNKVAVARKLVGLIVSVNDQQVPVWSVKASPFSDSESGEYADRTTKYLKILDSRAQEAKIKDPELEEQNSTATSDSKEEIIQKAQSTQANAKAQSIMDAVYKTGATGFASNGGAARTTGGANAAGGYYPNPTMSAPGGAPGSAGQFMGNANNTFNPEFVKKAGSDKGIKMSLAQGDQLMLNHLVKAGFRDNKTLALALAMARKETGGYQSTAEDTNWSAPTLLKYFKNIPDAATAQKVAAMSPVERAMYVYGRAPKGPQLGNTKPEDGWNYRGRGLFQLTGKANYEAFKKASGIDVVSHPELVSEDPNVMAQSAVWFLKNNAAMKSIAKTGDFDTAVRGINGGNAVPATDERRGYYQDYLDKLRSGSLTIPGGDNTDGAEQNDQAAMDNQEPVVPEAADKNVPATKVVKPGDVGALLDKAGQATAPSNVNTPVPTSNASPMSKAPVTSSGPAASNTNTPATSSTSTDNPQGTPPVGAVAPEQPTRQPVKSAVQAVNEKKAAEAAALPPTVNLPDQMSVSDKAVAEANVAQVGYLKEIRDILKANGNNQPYVHV